jgi:hypothetical protein
MALSFLPQINRQQQPSTSIKTWLEPHTSQRPLKVALARYVLFFDGSYVPSLHQRVYVPPFRSLQPEAWRRQRCQDRSLRCLECSINLTTPRVIGIWANSWSRPSSSLWLALVNRLYTLQLSSACYITCRVAPTFNRTEQSDDPLVIHPD